MNLIKKFTIILLWETTLTTFNFEKKNIEYYLIADLYKKLGNTSKSKESLDIATEVFERQLNYYKNEKERNLLKNNTEKYKTTENYKKWILQQRKEYKFE